MHAQPPRARRATLGDRENRLRNDLSFCHGRKVSHGHLGAGNEGIFRSQFRSCHLSADEGRQALIYRPKRSKQTPNKTWTPFVSFLGFSAVFSGLEGTSSENCGHFETPRTSSSQPMSDPVSQLAGLLFIGRRVNVIFLLF